MWLVLKPLGLHCLKRHIQSHPNTMRILTTVTRGLGLPAHRLAGHHTDAASKHSLCYFRSFSEQMVMHIDVHLQSVNVSVHWLWLLLLDVGAVSVVIVICDIPDRNSHCVNMCLFTICISKTESRVLKHDANFE